MNPVKRSLFFITGTDTGVGKTVLTGLLARYLRAQGLGVAALKPVCSGGRQDAKWLHAATGGALGLDEINPWHFRAPLTPLLAARRERRRLKLAQVKTQVRQVQKRFPIVLVEGAGGLLSPLGENFDSRDLIVALRAIPVVVCLNRLGAINQVLLVLAALPRRLARRAQVVMISPPRPTLAGRSNPRLLAEMLGADRIHVLPWLKQPLRSRHTFINRRVRRVLDRILSNAAA